MIAALRNAAPDLLRVVEAAQEFHAAGVPHSAWVKLWDALDILNGKVKAP